MAIFNSYVKLPEGNSTATLPQLLSSCSSWPPQGHETSRDGRAAQRGDRNLIESRILYLYIYIYISGQIITTSLFSLTGIMVSKGNHPKWPYFRFVNYYNLPRYIYIYIRSRD